MIRSSPNVQTLNRACCVNKVWLSADPLKRKAYHGRLVFSFNIESDEKRSALRIMKERDSLITRYQPAPLSLGPRDVPNATFNTDVYCYLSELWHHLIVKRALGTSIRFKQRFRMLLLRVGGLVRLNIEK